MCDKVTDPVDYKNINQATTMGQITRSESHMQYELRQKMNYHIRKIIDLQKAIDAIEATNY